MRTEERYDLGKLVTFEPNKRLPLYNWFPFKEAFSRNFVTSMLDQFDIREGSWVLDPFCGVGTTLLAAKERGVNAVGVDAHPVFAFVSQAKTHDYNLKILRESKREFFSRKFEKPSLEETNSLLKKAFSRYALEDILFSKSEISMIKDRIVRDFLVLALVVSAMRVSYAVKDGAVVRFFKRRHPPLRKVFKATVRRFVRHLRKAKFKPCKIVVRQGDARQLEFLETESFDAVVTSPPYLNKLEYTRAFDVEEALLKELIGIDSTKAFLGASLEEGGKSVFPKLKLPDITKAYLFDMKLCLREMYRVLRKGGKAALVVGQGVFPDRIVESDVLIARLAGNVGFSVEKRLIVNKRVVTRERTVKIGVALESILLLAK
ncbi:MAG: DNA methyltransferase [Candidatus Bathyarchaeia archaeon]